MTIDLGVRRRAILAAIAVVLVFSARAVSHPGPGERQQSVPEIGRPGKDVMWVPSPDPLVDSMLALAKVTADDVVMDLGSGDGRTVIAAARLGARAIGVEYDEELVALSQAAAAEAGVSDLTSFVAADLFDVDLSPATVITMFLLPELNSKLRPHLLDLAPGTRIVSNTWDLEDWEPDATVQLDPCPGFCTALLWVVPARVDGTWTTGAGTLTLEQQFQHVTGTLEVGAKRQSVEEGRLNGTEILFRVGDARYHGQVDDGVIEGGVETGGQRTTWRATLVTTP